ncbi:CoA transferase [Arenivirga flava]|nr:CoA transferase [Arenivirga flava]
MSSEDGLLAEVWRDVGGDTMRLVLVQGSSPPPLRAALPVARLVHDAVAAAALAAQELEDSAAPIRIDPVHAATAVTSERWFRHHGEAPRAWHPLSGFRPAADGFVRTHANYPHHHERLLRSLGLTGAADAAALDARIRSMTGAEVERAAAANGALAVAVRTEGEWGASPQGRAGAAGPLVQFERTGARLRWRRGARGSEPRRSPGARRTADAPTVAEGPRAAGAPLAGLRVLDLTRVIAGPVAGRTLALLGADVLRIDPPRLPELGWQHLDTGHGKRSALLDVRSVDGSARFERLLESANVLLLGYRPGALDVEAIVGRHPALVVAELSAWGWSGPWADRRGFDSLVQAASGIAVVEGATDTPSALPAQALDHATGYLLVAAVLRAVAEGGSARIRASLARTAAALLALPRGADAGAATAADAFEPSLVHLHGLTTAQPAFGRRSWPAPPRSWGGDPAAWR